MLLKPYLPSHRSSPVGSLRREVPLLMLLQNLGTDALLKHSMHSSVCALTSLNVASYKPPTQAERVSPSLVPVLVACGCISSALQNYVWSRRKSST